MTLHLHRCITICLFALASAPLCAQHHTGAPATAPPRPAPPPVAVSSGLGAIQFAAVSYSVPTPQLLSIQLRSDNERIRMAALSALGVPAQYLQRGRVATPRSIQIFFQQLGPGDTVDALLTVELDHHIVTAVLIPNGDIWRRIATLLIATPFGDTRNTASTFVHADRSLLDHDRYTAVFHATVPGSHGSFTENEARLMVFDKHAVIAISFVSAARDCVLVSKSSVAGGCTILRRWLQSEPDDSTSQFRLISATGHLTPREINGPLGASPAFDASHLHSLTCQPFIFSTQTHTFQPTADNSPCFTK